MARVELHYEAGDYTEAARLLDAAADACSEHPAWRLNMAHTLFMLTRYEYVWRRPEQPTCACCFAASVAPRFSVMLLSDALTSAVPRNVLDVFEL